MATGDLPVCMRVFLCVCVVNAAAWEHGYIYIDISIACHGLKKTYNTLKTPLTNQSALFVKT